MPSAHQSGHISGIGPSQHDLACLTISELEHLARDRMDKQTRDYYNEGADAGGTLSENMSAYKKYRIRPRVLRDVSVVDTSVNIFGQRNSVPFGVAPTAMQGLAHSDGELATAGACRNSNIVMGLSSFATSSLEEVAQACGNNARALQLYLFEEREHSRKFIARAKKAGFKAVLLTVDTPYLGRRNLEIRNQFVLPTHLQVANFRDSGKKSDIADDADIPLYERDASEPSTAARIKLANQNRAKRQPSEAGYTDDKGKRVLPKGPITFHTHAANPSLNWERDIPWLKKEAAPMEVWVKGIMTGEDAHLALHHNVDGIIVSNHGGRQLDGAMATIDALPDVIAAVKGKIPVHIDGGIRHGTDVFKALALGADFCWIGRPVLWGLAYKGEEGVNLCLKLLSDEVKLCMALAGVTKVEEINKEYLVKLSRDGFASRL